MENEEMMTVDAVEETEEETSGKSKFLAILAGAGLTAVAVTIWVKTKEKRKERFLKKLEAEGYEIIPPWAVVEGPDDSVEEE